ncbi:MAG: FAD-dependent oxidoreductase [Candidatus Caenarcaniphilales bacterium]|nr:FAD-dependent oxidoreductase [Candidatus Caenarcaniphilales bacterium]
MKKKIVILGAGYSGLQAALELNSQGFNCTLIDKNDFHELLPELPHILSDNSLKTTIPIKTLIKNKSIDFIKSEITKINYQKKQVELKDCSPVEFDYLVLAIGTNTNFFNIPGLEENSLTFHCTKDVDKFLLHIKNCFQTAKTLDPASDEYKQNLSVVVGGGGLTGVEVAGELLYELPKLAKEIGINKNDIQLYLVEAMDRLLMVLDKEVSETITEFFSKKEELHLLLKSAIKEVHPNQIQLSDGKVINAKTILWTGGIRANKLLEQPFIDENGQEAKFPLGRGFRVEVDEFYKVKGRQETFAIGDNALIIDPETQQPFAQNGQAAYKQGRIVAKHLVAIIENKELKTKKIKLDGLLVSLGPWLGSGMIINPLTLHLPISPLVRKMKKLIEMRYKYFDIRR